MSEHFSKKPNKAGGLSSLTSTLKHIIQSQQPQTNVKNLLKANQDKGFDCPGCAWGDEKEGLLQFCENGAKAIAWESTSKKVNADFFAQHSLSQLQKQSDYWLEYQGRLTQPMKYNKNTDHYEPIDWQDAYQLIAEKLNSLDSPNEAEFYTSGRASNEASFLYQLFGRLYGTNNFPDCSNMCHEASGVALNESIGIGKGTVVLDDFNHAEAIFVFGQNPGTNHPRMMNALRKAARGGCKIVSFNNLKEVALERFASPQDPIELLTPKATTISHAYFTPKLGGDMAAVRGMVKIILARNAEQKENGETTIIDNDFIKLHCQQFEQYQQVVNDTSWQQIEQQSGLTFEQLSQATDIFLSADKVICTWAMGITQHKHSVATIQEIVNLQLLSGNIGKKGAGLCPVRGHSNVQGNRTMGINEKPTTAFIEQLSRAVDTPLPKEKGHNVYYALNALLQKTSKVLICLGGNIAQAAPDTVQTHQALKNTELNVQISTKLNRSHLCIGQDALILPCLGRTEIDNQTTGAQFITVEDTFSMVHASQGNVVPLADSLHSETAIVADIANATLTSDKANGKLKSKANSASNDGTNSAINWLQLKGNYDLIRDLIEQAIPGFTDFNLQLEQPGGFYLGNSAAQLKWNNTQEKALFTANFLPKSIVNVSKEKLNELQHNKQPLYTLQSLRSHDQYNTTIYGMDDRYRGVINARNILFINKKDALKQGFRDNDYVDITSIWSDNQNRTVTNFILCFYDIPRSNLAAYYPETNPLVPLDSFGDRSYTPTSKSVAVIINEAKNPPLI
ncbi:FdhF/YdeP family oxidoreductase [Colwellia psychrerythraea]|uniref:Oxidoreductase alpha (Molybdopterin) subunit n=1 Tax=Colwellia psychrerythraea TaxID=28229 RepID=A0A099KSN0_COLPS|nr:FdhF/YdeP family oxidoreductase [Colwellia psychrerythraea]KGJ92887.1 oxidoreductase alpha (molybdopterin) subunit [Colwellia psychrerythraea]